MNKNISTIISILIFTIFINYVPSCNIKAQQVTEPSIPVYIVCPYHHDSLKNVYGISLAANSSALVYASQKYDTLQMHVQKSSAENTAHFTWLYTLIAILGTMNIVLLFSTARIRKELAQIKRFEHHQMHAASSPREHPDEEFSFKNKRK
jgi:hypothetical protein